MRRAWATFNSRPSHPCLGTCHPNHLVRTADPTITLNSRISAAGRRSKAKRLGGWTLRIDVRMDGAWTVRPWLAAWKRATETETPSSQRSRRDCCRRVGPSNAASAVLVRFTETGAPRSSLTAHAITSIAHPTRKIAARLVGRQEVAVKLSPAGCLPGWDDQCSTKTCPQLAAWQVGVLIFFHIAAAAALNTP
jgi:hypothetical protein